MFCRRKGLGRLAESPRRIELVKGGGKERKTHVEERISLSTYRSGSGRLSCRQVARIVADYYDDGSPLFFALVTVIAVRIMMRVVVIMMMVVVVTIIVAVMVAVVMMRLVMLLIIVVSFRHRTKGADATVKV